MAAMFRFLTFMLVAGVLSMSAAAPGFAVEPDEMLPDAAQEARARDISKGLRCLVCRNENIDDSNAKLAKDLRILVRERITAGDSDEQVVAYVVDRYGEYVLLKPRFSADNFFLWAAGPIMLILAGLVGFGFIRQRRTAAEPAAELSEAEKQELQNLL